MLRNQQGSQRALIKKRIMISKIARMTQVHTPSLMSNNLPNRIIKKLRKVMARCSKNNSKSNSRLIRPISNLFQNKYRCMAPPIFRPKKILRQTSRAYPKLLRSQIIPMILIHSKVTSQLGMILIFRTFQVRPIIKIL